MGLRSRVYKTLYEKHIQVPLMQASGMGGSGGGGGMVNQQAGGGFAVETPPVEPPFPGDPQPPSAGGMGQVQAQPTPGNRHSESFRVEVMQPNTGVISDYVGYRITCKPKVVPGIGGAQGVSVQKQIPQPGGGPAAISRMRSVEPPQPTPMQVAPPQ